MRDDTDDYRRRVRATREGRSPLSEDEARARETVENLGAKFLRGRASPGEERRLRDAMSLLRRTDKISTRELKLRARRGWV